MGNRSRKAALSAAGLMLIAGCAGGHSAGSAPPAVNFGPTSQLTNGAAVALSITVPPRQTQGTRRAASTQQPATARRVPSWISPSTYYVALDEYYQGKSIYFNYFPLSQCSPSGSTYTCNTNLPYGTVTLYTNLYDSTGYLLSTNMYSNPAPITIYANGSPYSNNIYVTTAAVIGNLQQASPSFCFAAGYQQTIPLYVLDADGNTIVGPIANPITATFTAYNGAGLGAINLYVTYNGSAIAANNLTLTDTSLYRSPYFFVSGQEGAIYVAGTLQNIPAYSNGALTYTATGGYAATGTYIAWGSEGTAAYGLYPIAVQQSLNQTVQCNAANGVFDAFQAVESFLDPSTGMPYLVTGDFNNNVTIIDAFVTANYTHAYTFFQGPNTYGNTPGPQSNLYTTYSFTPSSPFVNILTSSVITGRIDVVSSGQIDIFDTSNGMSIDDYVYPTAVTVTSNTRFDSDPAGGALYYNDVGTPYLYGINTSGGPPGSAFAVIDFSPTGGYPISGQIYSTAPSGNNSALQLVRGADNTDAFHVCAFSATAFTGSVSCHNTGSGDTNPVSMQYDPLSGDIMWASGGTSAFAFPAHNVSPATFIANFPGIPAIYTLTHNASRLLPGLEGVPGVAGFYGGPQTSGPCNGTGQVTWLRYNAGSWLYLATMCWPTHYLTLTYP